MKADWKILKDLEQAMDVFKDQLEIQRAAKDPEEIQKCVDALNKLRVHDGGKTAYERITRHRCNHTVIGFGESFPWQMSPDKTARDKLNSDFRDGIFLGVIWRTHA